MITGPQHSFTATGIVQLQRELPVEAIGVALMDSASEVDENASVSIDIDRSRVEIEVLLQGSDELDALTVAKRIISQICDGAELPVDFAQNRPLRPNEWHLIDDAAIPPQLAPA